MYLNQFGGNAKFKLAGDRLGAMLGGWVRDDVAELTEGSIYRKQERRPGIWMTTRGGRRKGRIMDMGITKGVDVFVRKVAPLGDPVEVTVRGYELSLRKADAEMIEVE